MSVPPPESRIISGEWRAYAATGATLGPSGGKSHAEGEWREAGHDDLIAFAKLGSGPRGRGLVQRDADACCGPCPSMERDRTARGWPRQRVHPVTQHGDHAPRRSRRGYRRDRRRRVGIGAATPPFSPDAAAISAAHDVIRTLHPESAASLEAALTAGLANILDGEPKVKGISLGRIAAAKMLERRKDDGWNATASYAPGSGRGIWVPTPPAHAAALLPHWGKVTPFALKTGDQFRPGAPAAIDSPRYLKELREVFEVGATNSSRRPPELTDAARFWQISGIQGWNPAARQVSTAKQQTLLANTQTFALLNVAIADALIACFDAKYTYNTWRPVTAIRAGLGGIGPVADWLPAIVTPPFPAYPSGHACAAGAAREVLERIFGPDGHAIELTSATAPGVTFRYASFKAIADQIDDARVYGGIHIREDQEVGGELGRKVGRFVYETLSQGRR